jgi:DNA-binding MarR family transcriptional regulator
VKTAIERSRKKIFGYMENRDRIGDDLIKKIIVYTLLMERSVPEETFFRKFLGTYWSQQTEDRLIYLVSTAQNRLQNLLKSALTSEGIRVKPAQSGILFLLKRKDGLTMTELGKALAIDNATITGLVDWLERDGFVRRNKSTSDRRALNICITLEGVEEVNRAKIVVKRVNESIKAGFSAEEIEAFKKILLNIVKDPCGK